MQGIEFAYNDALKPNKNVLQLLEKGYSIEAISEFMHVSESEVELIAEMNDFTVKTNEPETIGHRFARIWTKKSTKGEIEEYHKILNLSESKKGLKKKVVKLLFKNGWHINKIAYFTHLSITEIEDIRDNKTRVIDRNEQIKKLSEQGWSIEQISQVMKLPIEKIQKIIDSIPNSAT
jgi:DNA-binding transcriptional MerR regulator